METFEFAGSKVERKVLPVNTYTGFLSVVAEGKGSKVTWKGKFYRPYLLNPPTPEGMTDKDATSTMSSVYKEGLDNLKEILEEGDSKASAPSPTETTATPPSAPAPIATTTPTKVATPPVAPTAPATPTPPPGVDNPANDPKVAVSFDSTDPYSKHLQCKEGKKCKIDKFLLKGFRAFSQCQVCHGIDGNGSTIAPSLMDKLKNEITYDIFIDRVSNGFTGQIGVMPSWKNNPNIMKNINNLYAYLKARSDGIIPAGRLKKFKH